MPKLVYFHFHVIMIISWNLHIYHVFTPLDTQNSSLGVIILPNNTILCLHNEQPAANCSIHYGTDSSNLPYTDSAVDGGVITLTSNLTGNATHYIMSTAIGLLTVNLHGSFSTCTTQDLMVSNLTVQPQSNCGWPTGDDLLACYSGVTLGSTVVYYCANSSLVRVSGKSSRTCQSNGTWSGTTPSCVCNGKMSSIQYLVNLHTAKTNFC